MDAARIRRLFLDVIDLAPDQRHAFLQAPSIIPEEREAVLNLLAHDRGGATDTLLERSITEARREAVNGRFGSYELREAVGRGGMGAVYRAERVDGEVNQVVAIKILDREWLDPKAVERFRRERQILSALAHPNIARLLDTGTREDGRPYLIMEFIHGEPLDEYCRSRDPGIADKLRLFLPVCRAVEYAHSRLVVHRDLKPSNILVTPEGEPKLLDFGIARALDDADSSVTATLLLTPRYASPDQARGEPPSTATDVYGLGALLYFLLTGSPPHRVEGLSPMELVRHLCETEPEAPSSLRPELEGDLENIVRKAMHREPERRYASARDLARDIENYMEMRPVRATPDRFWYRAGRFVARRRWLLSAVTAASLAVAAGGWSAWTERQRADEESAAARAVNEFLQTDLLSQAGVRTQAERGVKPDPDLKVRTVLDRAALSVEKKFGRLPNVEASIHVVIGSAYADLGLDTNAQKHYKRAVDLYKSTGAKTGRALEAVDLLAQSAVRLGQPRDAEALFRQNLEIRGWPLREQRLAAAQARFGLGTLLKNEGKAADALPMLEQARAEMQRLLGHEHERTLAVAIELAVLQNNNGKREVAAGLLEEVVNVRRRTLGENHPVTLYGTSELGVLYRLHGRRAEAEAMLARAANGFDVTLGPDHPDCMNAWNNLAIALTSYGRYRQASEISERILATQRRLRGPEHPDSLTVANNLAVQYMHSGKYTRAAKLLEETLAAQTKRSGPEDLFTLTTMRNVGTVYREMGKLRESARLLATVVHLTEKRMGTHLDTARAMAEMARTRKAMGEFAEAERLFRDTLAMRTKLRDAKSQASLISVNDLAGLFIDTGRYAEAEKLYQETLATGRTLLGETHPVTLNAMSGMGSVYRKQGRLDEAASMMKEIVDSRRKLLGEEHPSTLRDMRDLAAVFRDQRRFAEAHLLMMNVLRAATAHQSSGQPLPDFPLVALRQQVEELARSLSRPGDILR